MMCDDRLFAPQLRALSNRPCQVVLPIGADRMWTLAQQVLDVAPPRFDLVGLSFGGILAMEVIAMAPERIRKLVLMSTNARAESGSVAAARKPQMAAVRRGGLRRIMETEVIPNFGPDGADQPRIDAAMVEQAMELGPEVFVTQSKALITRKDQRDGLAQIKAHTLVICGEGDKLCPPFRHREIADAIEGSHLHVYPGMGHLPVLEAPETINPLLQHFLA